MSIILVVILILIVICIIFEKKKITIFISSILKNKLYINTNKNKAKKSNISKFNNKNKSKTMKKLEKKSIFAYPPKKTKRTER